MAGVDPRIEEGMERQVALRARLLDRGARHLGWKVGFGAPASLDLLEIEHPLVGFLTDRTLLADGGGASIADWARPVAEAEIALQLAADVPAGADEGTIRAAVGALGPAIELADVAPPPSPSDVAEILAGDIFHRALVLGPTVDPHAGALASGLAARVEISGHAVDVPDDLEALTGRLEWIVGLVAEAVGVHGVGLAAGDVILPGSIVPPQPLAPGDRVRFALSPAGEVAVAVR